MRPKTATQAALLLQGDSVPVAESLWLDLGHCVLRLRSNSQPLLDKLGVYFAHTLTDERPADLEVLAIESEEPTLPVEFIDWQREPGKTGRKDSYAELDDGRLVRKVRTGMVFLQSEACRVAAGPCLRYDNQVINFINAQYMNWLQHRDWLICHAAGLVRADHCLGIAGLSGGGKSTLMLNLMDLDGVGFMTNDRLFIHRQGEGVAAAGIPKLPRINPGTIVHNPRLHALIPEARRRELLAWPQQKLWELEEKHDVMVETLYGAGSIVPQANLNNFLVLNWRRGDHTPLKVETVDLAARPDILGAIMKSPGPFYQYPDGHFLQDTDPLDPAPYLDYLADIPVYEASGGIDFAGLARFCREQLLR